MYILIHSIKFYITINNNNNDDDNINNDDNINHYYYPSIKLYISIALLIFFSFKHHLHNHSHNSIFISANGWISAPFIRFIWLLFVYGTCMFCKFTRTSRCDSVFSLKVHRDCH